MLSLVSFRFWRRPRIHVGMTHAHIIDRLECFCILVCLQYQISCRPCACRGVKVPEENACTLANRVRSIDLHSARLSVTMFQSHMRSSLLAVNLNADWLCAFSVLDWIVIVVYQIRVSVMCIFLEEAGYENVLTLIVVNFFLDSVTMADHLPVLVRCGFSWPG